MSCRIRSTGSTWKDLQRNKASDDCPSASLRGSVGVRSIPTKRVRSVYTMGRILPGLNLPFKKRTPWEPCPRWALLQRGPIGNRHPTRGLRLPWRKPRHTIPGGSVTRSQGRDCEHLRWRKSPCRTVARQGLWVAPRPPQMMLSKDYVPRCVDT